MRDRILKDLRNPIKILQSIFKKRKSLRSSGSITDTFGFKPVLAMQKGGVFCVQFN